MFMDGRAHVSGRFHGIDERIGVQNYAELVLFMREFVQQADAQSAPV